jgi:ribonucleotide monophosphatase NagD (HAD superfamily)
MDIGGFIEALEYASRTSAILIGKPSPDFFRQALGTMSLPPADVAIIGDDIDVDIGGGQQAGLQTILVRTGKYRREYAEASHIKPDALIDSIKDLPALLGV